MQARILIAEDNRVVARDLAQQLSAMGHVVVATVVRGEDVAWQARETQADLVLMDIRLEGRIDGVTASAEIRDQCRVPVVFLTAYADEPTLRRALESEPFGYLLKPFDELQLRMVVEMALSKAATERLLRASEQRFVTTLSSIGDAVVATDAHGLVSFINPTAEAVLGRSQADVVGSAFADLLVLTEEGTGHPIEDPAVHALQSGTAVAQRDAWLRLAGTGRELQVTYSAAPILNDQGVATGAVLVLSDQTERRATAERLGQTRAALVRAARLTTIGELAASIAHEVNQPLMAAVANADACVHWLEAAAPNIEEAILAARRIVQNGHRAAEVIGSIRAIARNGVPNVAAIPLSGILQEVLSLIRMEVGPTDVVVASSVDEGLPPVLADPVQLRQVFLNLILNGIEAQAAQATERRVQVDARLASPEMMVVRVSDLGPGFDAVLAERLFDPLFTTKSDGMGLGLSICRSIILAHGGQIGAAPLQPTGSVFHFTLPTAGGGAARAAGL